MASKEETGEAQIHSPITNGKRDLASDSPEVSTLKKQRTDSSISPPPITDTISNKGGQDTDPISISPQENNTNDSSLDQSSIIVEGPQQEAFSIFGETDPDENSDVDVDIMTDEYSPDLLGTNNEPMESVDPTTGTDINTTKTIDHSPSSPETATGTVKEAVIETGSHKTSEPTSMTTNKAQSAEAPPSSSLTVDKAQVAVTPSSSTPSLALDKAQSTASPPLSSPLAIDKAHSMSTPSATQRIVVSPPSSQINQDPRTTLIDRSSAVRLPFSDKFFFTDEAYESYSCDSFAANIDRLISKNKPGLALSSKSSDISTIHLSLPSHGPPNSQHDDGNSIDEGRSRQIDPPSVDSGSMLDSLLDSISKNDRPVKQPPPMRPLSDIEIAMQAADPSQEQAQVE